MQSPVEYNSDMEEVEEIVDISTLEQQVKFMRSRKVNKSNKSIDSDLHESIDLQSSGSDYALSEGGIHSSDSDWSSNDDDVLKIRQKRDDSTDDESYDLPLIDLARTKGRLSVVDHQASSSRDDPQTTREPVSLDLSGHITGTITEDVDENPNTTEEEDDIMTVNDPPLDNVTPSTSSEPAEGRGRKRRRGTDRKEMKKRRDKGLSFVDRRGTEREARAMKLGCGKGCSKKCHSEFKRNERQDIFHAFWQLGDNTAQRLFINNCVQQGVPRRTYVKHQSRRQQTIVYTFTKDGTKKSVCKKFFLDTLGIKEDFVYTSLRCHAKNTQETVISDQRGKHGHQKKLSASMKDRIRQHINSFQPIESHYCRKSSNKMYLPETLSVQEMYRLYCKYCEENGESKASASSYRNVFDTDFNLGFYRPKKDQCDLCLSHKNNPDSVDEDTMKEHLKQKQLARELKESFKTICIENENSSCACFDLQKVLECPHGQASSFYYARKLAVYNLTVFELNSSEGYCFMWPEHLAKRGANEISSCIFHFLQTKANEGKKKVYTFSDNCAGQNRNKGIAAMFWYAIKTTALEEVIHTYLEKGHTQSENDSMHSVIERSARHATVFTPDQWYALVRNARKSKNQYLVKEMAMPDFKDFMGMASQIKNFKIDQEGQNLNWTKLRSISVKRSSPNLMFFKYDLSKDFKTIDLFRNYRNKMGSINLTVTDVLSSPGLKLQKKNDLIRLCDANLIPTVYHSFFHSIPVSVSESDEAED